mmetsp:Transcript_19633/g.39991  ORF Transcript_19633/g.39991 Transcript_19633/m.39991 type:complete len:207 (-) Transcript_19633:129-749(-)
MAAGTMQAAGTVTQGLTFMPIGTAAPAPWAAAQRFPSQAPPVVGHSALAASLGLELLQGSFADIGRSREHSSLATVGSNASSQGAVASFGMMPTSPAPELPQAAAVVPNTPSGAELSPAMVGLHLLQGVFASAATPPTESSESAVSRGVSASSGVSTASTVLTATRPLSATSAPPLLQNMVELLWRLAREEHTARHARERPAASAR